MDSKTSLKDPKRISEIMSLLGEYWTLNPSTMDLRLGQIMSNLIYSTVRQPKNIYYLEDDEVIEELKKMIAKAKGEEDGVKR